MKKVVKNNKGQTVVEAVLLIAVFVLVATTVSRQFRDNQLLARVISGPWDSLSGMIQNGVWSPPSESDVSHPGHLERRLSTDE